MASPAPHQPVSGRQTVAEVPLTVLSFGAYFVNNAITGDAVAANTTNPNTLLAPTYRIPIENEWYKAAYYDWSQLVYYRFATINNDQPGTTPSPEPQANQANYNGAIGHATDVGAFSGSWGPFLTYDQTGNVWQWNDLDGTTGSSRGLRGGSWTDNVEQVSSAYRINSFKPSDEGYSLGFRLAGPA